MHRQIQERTSQQWTAVAFWLFTETVRWESGNEQSSQWAELQAAWLVVANESSSIVICVDSWALHQDITLWIVTRHAKKKKISNAPALVDPSLVARLVGDDTSEITVCHVMGHMTLAYPGNDGVDALANARWLEKAPANHVFNGYINSCYIQSKR